jgi:hypothetical protein
MESTAPPGVDLISPVDNFKPRQPVTFSWNASSDPSGVTYELQVSADAGFNSLILEINDLTATEYTMGEVEKLDSVSTKTPYYWRVRAIDGAFNASNWSTDTFIIGLIWPVWLTYTLGGIGALIALIISGLWLRRRMAVSREDQSYNYDIDIEDQYNDQYQNRDLHRDR